MITLPVDDDESMPLESSIRAAFTQPANEQLVSYVIVSEWQDENGDRSILARASGFPWESVGLIQHVIRQDYFYSEYEGEEAE